MPTKRPRHMITETAVVEEALAPLRARGAKIDFAELVCRGADATMREIEQERHDGEQRRALRAQFADPEASAADFDLDLVLEVRERAWTPE